jgi:5-methyltetrahydrofolate--homocysteine methyltransferase
MRNALNHEQLSNLKNQIVAMRTIDEVRGTVERALKSGVAAASIIDAMSAALYEVGDKYEAGEFFLSELMMSAMLATELTRVIEPYLQPGERKMVGKVVIGTVKGDIHDIGKNLVVMMLRTAGFEVNDLGIDVAADKFVDSVRGQKPNVVAMSALLTSTAAEMKNVVDSFNREGLRNRVKILVGGRAVTREFADEIGADGYGKDSVEATRVAKKLLEQV